MNRVDYLSVTSSDGAILKLIEPLRGRRTLVVAPVVFRSLCSREKQNKRSYKYNPFCKR